MDLKTDTIIVDKEDIVLNEAWMNQYWWLLLICVFWELFWKGWALWKAARNSDKAWFVTLLVINALGLLSIAYIFVFSKRSAHNELEK